MGDTMRPPKATLFHPVAERINLGLPMIFGVAFLIATSLHYRPTTSDDYLLQNAVGFFFLNTTHVSFTFLMFLLLPEARQLLKESIQRRRAWPYLVVTFTIALLLYNLAIGYKYFAIYPPLNKFIVLALFGLANHHMVAQIYGLSMLYNGVSEPLPSTTAATLVRLGRLKALERGLFRVLLPTVLVVPFVFGMHIPHVYTGALYFFHRALIFGILGTSWFIGRICPSGKFIYLTRLLIWAFVPYLFSDLIMRSLHGVEYLFITDKMITSSTRTKSRRRTASFWLGSIIGYPFLFYVSLHYWQWLPDGGVLSLSVLPILFALLPFLQYVHYYLDSVLFRFKDSNVRRLVGPLLIPLRPLHLEIAGHLDLPPGAKTYKRGFPTGSNLSPAAPGAFLGES
jgi:hypothetical protein